MEPETEHEKSLHLIHKEVEAGRLEIGADTKYLQSHLTYMQLEHQNTQRNDAWDLHRSDAKLNLQSQESQRIPNGNNNKMIIYHLTIKLLKPNK